MLEICSKWISRLPDDVSWDDVMYEMYVRNKIDKGLATADEGRILSHEEVKKRFCQQ